MDGEDGFTAKERNAIRSEFMFRFGGARSIHKGFMAKRWATGPRKGQPKVSPTIQGMIDRGLLELADLDRHFPSARFTAKGFAALRKMAEDKRALPEKDYAHVLAELAALPGGEG